MKFNEFIIKKFSIKKISLEVNEDLYIQGKDIHVLRDKRMIVQDYSQYDLPVLIQMIKDYLSKNYSEEFDLKDYIESIAYSENRIKEVDNHLLDNCRLYSDKSLITLIKDDNETYIYAIGFKSESLEDIWDIVGLPKHGYSLKILKGKFRGTKTILPNGKEAYVISDYELRNADGITELEDKAGNTHKIKHIRRKI